MGIPSLTHTPGQGPKSVITGQSLPDITPRGSSRNPVMTTRRLGRADGHRLPGLDVRISRLSIVYFTTTEGSAAIVVPSLQRHRHDCLRPSVRNWLTKEALIQRALAIWHGRSSVSLSYGATRRTRPQGSGDDDGQGGAGAWICW